MFALRLASICLLPVMAAAAGLEQTPGGKIQIYLKSDGGASPLILAEMKEELASIVSGLGARIAWWNPATGSTGVDGLVIVADFRGTCAAPAGPPGAVRTGLASLASTAVAGGQVLPFSSVDCDAVSALIADHLLPLPAPQRSLLYGRALARVLAHEIYHVLIQTVGHGRTGVAKARFTAADLVAERFDFSDPVTTR